MISLDKESSSSATEELPVHRKDPTEMTHPLRVSPPSITLIHQRKDKTSQQHSDEDIPTDSGYVTAGCQYIPIHIPQVTTPTVHSSQRRSLTYQRTSPLCDVRDISDHNMAVVALIDLEALITREADIVEQIGFLVIGLAEGYPYVDIKVIEEHHIDVLQNRDRNQLAEHFHTYRSEIDKAIEGYYLVTKDNFIHKNATPWVEARKFVVDTVHKYNASVWAKGAELERRVFGSFFAINDLADYGCPRYPYAIHNPLEECKFFSKFLPISAFYFSHSWH